MNYPVDCRVAPDRFPPEKVRGREGFGCFGYTRRQGGERQRQIHNSWCLHDQDEAQGSNESRQALDVRPGNEGQGKASKDSRKGLRRVSFEEECVNILPQGVSSRPLPSWLRRVLEVSLSLEILWGCMQAVPFLAQHGKLCSILRIMILILRLGPSWVQK